MSLRWPALLTGGVAAMVCAACSAADDSVDEAVIEQIATIQDPAINEASGLTVSQRRDDLVWTHNDSGSKSHLYALDGSGRSLLRLRLDKTDNKDWEDLASFELNGDATLLVGDIGDNEARRKHIALYLVAEPVPGDDDRIREEPNRKISVRYPDGPRDAEALAITNQTAYILSKRDLPPRLYAVNLADTADEVEAEWLANIVTLPPPTKRDIEFAPKTKNWFWQPTAMDIARDGSAVAILTYAAVYYYVREGDEALSETLARPPLALSLGNIRDAEALAFSADGGSLLLTVEKKNAPLYRIRLPARTQHGDSP